MKPTLVDFFCGEGGASQGYNLAGWRVAGVDIRRRRRYPFPSAEADLAISEVAYWVKFWGAQAAHASPPCQKFSALNNGTWGNADGHPDLIAPIREQFLALGLPYVIENVPRAPLRDPVTLCGTMFGLEADGFQLRRHRLFETNFPLAAPAPHKHDRKTLGVYGHGRGGGPLKGRSANADQARRIMGMPWASRDGISQAIPPAYTEFIGEVMLKHV